MLTYTLKKEPGLPLYEDLYRAIRADILCGRLAPGQKLPSKRALARNLEVSKITVEAAYDQLLSQGYIRSQEKVGYFVENIAPPVRQAAPVPISEPEGPVYKTAEGFPFSVWRRLQREVVLDYGERLLQSMPNTGIPELRQAISSHLAAFRGLEVEPRNILVGAGTDFLYNLLIQLLGRELVYAVEDPGYHKIRSIYRAGGVRCVSVPMDGRGVRPNCLGSARVLHISPSHHYPTGIVTDPQRRQELLRWARETDSWIIEDDYDSEFRFDARPMAALQTLAGDRVIYMNSFSKSLAPSIRISYMVLPPALMEKFHRELDFYSCTVPSFEQYTLARFLSRGHFEKHINRMRKFYRSRRNKLLSRLKASQIADKMEILEKDAGLHFILKVNTSLTDRELTKKLREAAVPFPALSAFYENQKEDLHCLVVSYAGLEEETVERAIRVLAEV